MDEWVIVDIDPKRGDGDELVCNQLEISLKSVWSGMDMRGFRTNSLAVLVVIVASVVFGRGPAAAYSPDDPEVQAMVDRGLEYLAGLSEKDIQAGGYGQPESEPMLIAYTYLKATGEVDHPVVRIGIKNAEAYIQRVRNKFERPKNHSDKATYELSVAIMFLVEVDAKKYANDIQFLADTLLGSQMSHGGYGYYGDQHGDTSQVQYVSLAMWTLDRAGFNIDYSRVGRLAQWIVRAQDPTGYWTYQPEIQSSSGLTKQPVVNLSLSTCLAAGSAVLIAADVLRQWGDSEDLSDQIEGMPEAVREILVEESTQQRQESARQRAAQAPSNLILEAINRFEGYRAKNPKYQGGQLDFTYYMMYTMERYESFIEIAAPSRANNAWYVDGVNMLKEAQADDGSWGTERRSATRPPVSTAFAILFLIRSTKKAIAMESRGTVAGGQGLPSDTSKIIVSGTQIKGEPVAGQVTDLLDMLGEDDDGELNEKSIPEQLELETEPQRRRQQLERLERLVRGSRSWQARRVAARVLGRSDEMAVVPALIFALSDPDKIVRQSALDGLRFISRQFDTGEMPEDPSSSDIRKIQQRWRDWYHTIYPGYIFLDDGL